jgi:hypothetical protein
MVNEFVERIEEVLADCYDNLPTDGVLETLLETLLVVQNRIFEVCTIAHGPSVKEIVDNLNGFLEDKTKGRIIEFPCLSDNPTCAGCGSVMIRSNEGEGNCFVCSNCGLKSGCS